MRYAEVQRTHLAYLACILSLAAVQATGGLIVGFLYATGAIPLDVIHDPHSAPVIHHDRTLRAVGWRWLSIGSAGIAGLALVYNSLLPTLPLREAGPKLESEGVSKALCSAEFAAHAWTAFNMGWSAHWLTLSLESCHS